MTFGKLLMMALITVNTMFVAQSDLDTLEAFWKNFRARRLYVLSHELICLED